MFYAVTQFPIDTADSRDQRAEAINKELERLARQRTRLLRAEQERHQGRMLTPLAEETDGDVIMVMVDAGHGEQVKEDIASLLGL